jgi:hypothetical protein
MAHSVVCLQLWSDFPDVARLRDAQVLLRRQSINVKPAPRGFIICQVLKVSATLPHNRYDENQFAAL